MAAVADGCCVCCFMCWSGCVKSCDQQQTESLSNHCLFLFHSTPLSFCLLMMLVRKTRNNAVQHHHVDWNSWFGTPHLQQVAFSTKGTPLLHLCTHTKNTHYEKLLYSPALQCTRLRLPCNNKDKTIQICAPRPSTSTTNKRII